MLLAMLSQPRPPMTLNSGRAPASGSSGNEALLRPICHPLLRHRLFLPTLGRPDAATKQQRAVSGPAS
jgi:hypothetical protein